MILVTGGAGYIGAHVNKLLNESGYETIVLDNLSKGHKYAVKWGKLVNADLNVSIVENNDNQLIIDIYVSENIEPYVRHRDRKGRGGLKNFSGGDILGCPFQFNRVFKRAYKVVWCCMP